MSLITAQSLASYRDFLCPSNKGPRDRPHSSNFRLRAVSQCPSYCLSYQLRSPSHLYRLSKISYRSSQHVSKILQTKFSILFFRAPVSNPHPWVRAISLKAGACSYTIIQLSNRCCTVTASSQLDVSNETSLSCSQKYSVLPSVSLATAMLGFYISFKICEHSYEPDGLILYVFSTFMSSISFTLSLLVSFLLFRLVHGLCLGSEALVQSLARDSNIASVSVADRRLVYTLLILNLPLCKTQGLDCISTSFLSSQDETHGLSFIRSIVGSRGRSSVTRAACCWKNPRKYQASHASV